MTKAHWKHFKIFPKKPSVRDNTVLYQSIHWQFRQVREAVDRKITHVSERVSKASPSKTAPLVSNPISIVYQFINSVRLRKSLTLS